MKITRKALVAPVVVLAMAGGTAATALAATSGTGTSKIPSLASEIAQKFGLDQSQVQSVITEHRSEVQQNREAKYEARLDKAVSDGKLTSTQKQAVLDEHDKLVSELQSATSGSKHQTLKTVRQEAKTWAAQNKIEVKWLLPVRDVADNQTSPNS